MVDRAINIHRGECRERGESFVGWTRSSDHRFLPPGDCEREKSDLVATGILQCGRASCRSISDRLEACPTNLNPVGPASVPVIGEPPAETHQHPTSIPIARVPSGKLAGCFDSGGRVWEPENWAVPPAKAGVQKTWIPASAGMTVMDLCQANSSHFFLCVLGVLCGQQLRILFQGSV